MYTQHYSCNSDCHAAPAWFLQASLRTSQPLHKSAYSVTAEVTSVSSQPAHTNETHMGSSSFTSLLTPYQPAHTKSFFLDAIDSLELQKGHQEQLVSVSDTVGTEGHPIKLPCGKFKIKNSTSSMYCSSVWLVTPGGHKVRSSKNYYLHLLVEKW